MTDYFEKETELSGMFTFPTGEKASGTLNLAGPESYLYVWSEKTSGLSEIQRHLEPVFPIKGVLSSGNNVSLINCRKKSSHWSEHLTNISFFFDYAIFGNTHISHKEKKLEKVTFTIDDAESLFYEPEVFGAIMGGEISPEKRRALAFPPWPSPWSEIDARQLVEQIVRSQGVESKIEVGTNPVIFYHTGKTRILDVNTVLGKVSVSRNDLVRDYAKFLGNFESEGRSGVTIENKISINLEFDNMLVLEDAVSRAFWVLRFLELLVGHSQNFVSFLISKSGTSKPLRVYGCQFPAHKRFGNESYFVLLDAVKDPQQFSRILANWLERDNNGRWREARDRFFSCFEKHRNYDIDRLIAAANMFDLLPIEAFPEEAEIPEDLESARDKCREIFSKLPASPDQHSVLSALGRVGNNASLKKKIRHRAQIVIDEIGENRIPNLLEATDKAVDCRNRYVHGTKHDKDTNYKAGEIRFLTETLEFVFAASDLIEAEWAMKSWSLKNEYPDHPFRSYLPRLSSVLVGKPVLIL